MKRRTTTDLIDDLHKMIPGATINHENGYGWTVRTENGTLYSDTYTGIVKLIKKGTKK